MTREEKIEFDYRVAERLGMLCGASKPTPDQCEIAVSEANAWLRQSRGELI